jgi:hypothetical protein
MEYANGLSIAEVTDLYEAAYLVTEGCRIEGVRCIPLSKSVGCSFTVSGAGLVLKREAFIEKRAAVNLYAFRSAYTQVNSYMVEAKKAYEREQRGKGASQ